jgi:hypothetical protein
LIQRHFMTLGRLSVGLLPECVVIVLVLGAVRAFFPAVSPAIGHAVWLGGQPLPSLAMVGPAVPGRALAFVTGSVIVTGLVVAGLAVAFGL